MNAFDCKNGGNLKQMNINGQLNQFCECIDTIHGDNMVWTGPQCQYESKVKPSQETAAQTSTDTEADTFYTITQAGSDVVPLAQTGGE